jgi:hypothetical protein
MEKYKLFIAIASCFILMSCTDKGELTNSPPNTSSPKVESIAAPPQSEETPQKDESIEEKPQTEESPQIEETSDIKIINASERPLNDILSYYIFITSSNEGPIKWTEPVHGADFGEGLGFRIVITTSEIYNNVMIEEVKHFGEGAKKLHSIREIDLNEFTKKFGLYGEISGFTFVRWIDNSTFAFIFHDRGFIASQIDKSKIIVTKVDKSTIIDTKVSQIKKIFSSITGMSIRNRVLFENEIEGTYCSSLYADNKFIGWIDDAHRAGDTVVVSKCAEEENVANNNVPLGSLYGGKEEGLYKLVNEASWSLEEVNVPEFNYFSNPSFCNSWIAYWGIKKDKSMVSVNYDKTIASALAYNLKTLELVKESIGHFSLETDFSAYLQSPIWGEDCKEVDFYSPEQMEKPVKVKVE